MLVCVSQIVWIGVGIRNIEFYLSSQTSYGRWEQICNSSGGYMNKMTQDTENPGSKNLIIKYFNIQMKTNKQMSMPRIDMVYTNNRDKKDRENPGKSGRNKVILRRQIVGEEVADHSGSRTVVRTLIELYCYWMILFRELA